jgi:hypothetical protein
MRTLAVVIVLFLLIGLPSAYAAAETQISQISQVVADPMPYRFATAVASSGNGYLVAWGAVSTESHGSSLQDLPLTISIRALSADGTPVRPFATVVGVGERPSIAWNGHEYLVVWGIITPTTGSLPTPSVVGIRVREDGMLIDPAPVTLVAEVNPYSYLTTVSWSGSQYLVSWSRGIAFVDAGLHGKIVPLSGGIPLYSASSGGDFIVIPAVFSNGPYGVRQTLLIAPVSSTGNASTLIPLEGPHAGIAGIDGGYALIWDDYASGLRSARLRADGTMISTSTSTVYLGAIRYPTLAARDGRIVGAWQNDQFSTCTARIDIAGQPLCASPGQQHDPAIGIAAKSILVAWSAREAGVDSIRVAVSSSGDVPRADNNLASIISDPELPAPAAVRRPDGAVTAAWTEYSQIKKQFEVHIGGINSKGVRLADRVVFATALDQRSPIISAGNGRTMILWTEGTEPKIRMSIVDDVSGAVIATFSLPAGVAPSAAFNGKEWLLTWQSAADSVVRVAIVNSDGFVLSSGTVPATSTASPAQSAPAAAWSGKTFFLTWLESAGPGQAGANRVQLSTINAAGVPSAPVTLDSADVLPGTPSIAGNGGRVLVSWGRPGNTLRQALFDSDGKQLGKFIDFAWPYAITRTRSHPMTGGFATLSGSRLALTSTDGVALDSIEIPPAAGGGDFVVDPANRFTFLYARLVGSAGSANFAQTIGLPRRRPQNR